MPVTRFHRTRDDAELYEGIRAIRDEMNLPTDHSDAAAGEAIEAAAAGPAYPPGAPCQRDDRRDLAIVAIDPAGARDLDQAFTAQRLGSGYRVHYAIADVFAFVAPGGPIDRTSLDRGVTFYAPDRKVSLHPEAINESAASLLPGVDRPCLLWQFDLDDQGELVSASIARATVRVREALSYRAAQAEIDGGAPRDCLVLLEEIGRLREDLATARGAVGLNIPAQEIVRRSDGSHELVYDESLPVEDWNAQISLLTGMAAAQMMLGAGVGLLRTLPSAAPDTVSALRRTADALDVAWGPDATYAERVRSLDPNEPTERALLERAARALGGAGYAAFVTAEEIPTDASHFAIGAPYAHVTAPLRRVCDRYSNEILLAVEAGRPAPDWATETLVSLPAVMGRARQRERAFEKAVLDLVEVLVLEPYVGQQFQATVVDVRSGRSVVALAEPAIVTELDAVLDLGARIRVELTAVERAERRLTFRVLPQSSSEALS